MKNSGLFFLLILNSFFLTSCAQDKSKKATSVVSKTTVSNSSQDFFEMTLGPTFYMSGDDLNDLYIDVTINKGTIKSNAEVEIVKKDNPTEKISATIYRIDDKSFQPIKMANAGQQVTINLKVKNDKNFRLSNNGNEYTIVSKGKTVTNVASKKNTGKAVILIDGKPWEYEYYHVYHYTKDYGVTKNPANFLITFTKPNKNLKNTPEEVLQLSLFHATKSAKIYEKSAIDFSITNDMFGEERVYSKTLKSDNRATASVTKYILEENKAIISGKVDLDAKGFMCNGCPNIKVSISFENLNVELYNN